MPKISIIVPVYNVELYLRECLDSIRRQTFTDWECVLVDDGSTDGPPAICEEYAAADSRFRVMHKDNGGLSDARNAGIRVAKADLIGFVDSDDWVEPGMFALLYELISTTGADIAQVGVIKEYKGRHSAKPVTDVRKVIAGQEAMRLTSTGKLPSYVWNKLQRRDIMTCDFPKGRNFEDIYVYGHWLKNVRLMALDPAPMYHYRMRKGSIAHTDVAKNRYDNYLSGLDRMNMLETAGMQTPNPFWKQVFINRQAANMAKIIARDEKDRTLRDETILRLSAEVKEYLLPSIKYMGVKPWVRAKLLRERPLLFGRIMRLVHVIDFSGKALQRKFYD